MLYNCHVAAHANRHSTCAAQISTEKRALLPGIDLFQLLRWNGLNSFGTMKSQGFFLWPPQLLQKHTHTKSTLLAIPRLQIKILVRLWVKVSPMILRSRK